MINPLKDWLPEWWTNGIPKGNSYSGSAPVNLSSIFPFPLPWKTCKKSCIFTSQANVWRTVSMWQSTMELYRRRARTSPLTWIRTHSFSSTGKIIISSPGTKKKFTMCSSYWRRLVSKNLVHFPQLYPGKSWKGCWENNAQGRAVNKNFLVNIRSEWKWPDKCSVWVFFKILNDWS